MDVYVGGESCILKCVHVCCECVHVPVCGVVSKCKFRLLHTGAGGMIALTILPPPPPHPQKKKTKSVQAEAASIIPQVCHYCVPINSQNLNINGHDLQNSSCSKFDNITHTCRMVPTDVLVSLGFGKIQPNAITDNDNLDLCSQ